MSQVIPALLEHRLSGLCVRLSQIHAARYHLDIMDGSWLHHRTIGAKQLQKIRTDAHLEAHLMVKNPVRKIAKFKGLVDGVIVHLEQLKDIDDYVKKARALGFSVGIAVNPQTPLTRLLPHMQGLDKVLIMTVHPGRQGAPFEQEALQKVRALRKRPRGPLVCVDGGMHHGTIKRAVKAGAQWIIVGSAIVNAEHPQKAFETLQKEAA